MSKQLLARGKHGLIVEVDLIGARARPGLDDRVHGVVPAGALLEARPVRRPAEVGRVDIRRQPLLETMQLVRSAEVHFAGQCRPIAGAAQVVREGWHLRGELGGVVIGTDLGRQLPGKPRVARGRA